MCEVFLQALEMDVFDGTAAVAGGEHGRRSTGFEADAALGNGCAATETALGH